MRDRPEIERKLKLLAEYLNELDQISQASYKQYQTDFQVKRTAERLIQLVVEVATDVNGLLIVGLGEAPPQVYFTSFTNLSQLGILPEDFAQTLAPTTAIRNRLVHEYDRVDDRLVYISIKPILEEFTQYLDTIRKYVQKKS